VDTLRQQWQYRQLFGGILALYSVLNLLLVRGVSSSHNLASVKASLDAATHGLGDKIGNSVTSFGYLLTTSGGNNVANSGVYQSILLVVCSLAFIWALRQSVAKQKARVRDSFYSGMYPLVPFLLVFFLASLQLVPMGIGTSLYNLGVTGGIAVHAWEKAGFIAVAFGLTIWSLRMLTASIFAMYIVTLPDMTPLRAYYSARLLVYGRRLLLWRKILFLVVAMLLLAAVIEVPIILFLTPLAPWVLFGLSMVALPIVHGYFYNLYRGMI